MSNPFIDFESMTQEELLEKNKEYTMQLQKINGNSPIYQQILDLQTQCQQAGYPAQISNAPYGSSIAVAAVDCNTTLSGGGKRTKRKQNKKRKTNKKRSKNTKKK